MLTCRLALLKWIPIVVPYNFSTYDSNKSCVPLSDYLNGSLIVTINNPTKTPNIVVISTQFLHPYSSFINDVKFANPTPKLMAVT